jgi:hypothetical protein
MPFKRSNVYKAVRDRLISEIPALKTVDLQRGQIYPGKDNKFTYPFPMPVSLISLSKTVWTDLGGAMQRGVINIAVDYYVERVTDSFSGSESEEDTINLIDAPDDIFRALYNYKIDGLFEKLIRISEEEIKRNDRLTGYRILFQTYVYESK